MFINRESCRSNSIALSFLFGNVHKDQGDIMKKYQDYTKAELLNIIKDKNNTIQKLNGQVYYYRRMKNHYKEAQVKYYEKLNNLR